MKMTRTLSIVDQGNMLDFSVVIPAGPQPRFWDIVSKIGSLELVNLPQYAVVAEPFHSETQDVMLCQVAKVMVPFHSASPDSLESFTEFLGNHIAYKGSLLLPRSLGDSTEWYFLKRVVSLPSRHTMVNSSAQNVGHNKNMHKVHSIRLLGSDKSELTEVVPATYGDNFLWFVRSNYRPFDASCESTMAYCDGMSRPLPLTEWIIGESGFECIFETFFSF
jgi:hypothetical protein